MEEDNANKSEINVHNGAQVIFANDNATVYVTQNNSNESKNTQQKVKSRTQEYADKWNANMFLNDFNKRDENAGINVKLSEVYVDEHLPHYIWKGNKSPMVDLRELLSEYMCVSSSNKMLLILGQPGVGKSTLITWIAANFTDIIDNVFVYKFADDLADINWQNTDERYNIAYDIFLKLDFSYDKLDGKTLIFDGFDEISVQSRIDILNRLFWQLIKGCPLNNFTLIITSRENYIQDLHKCKFNYITLQSWDMEQVRSFCSIFQKKTKNSISESTIEKILKNREILGVPLILYMVLALNISIEKDGSIVDVYDKVFSLDGGIYDRCINNKSFAEPHRIGEAKKQIHQISREIAIWMFENEPDKAIIPQEEYQKICINVMQESVQENKNMPHDFMIGGFFKLVRHCEGVETEELYFVHRSIYEYFVAETIYSSIESAMIKLSEESQEELAGNIAVYLKQGLITNTIGEYLQFKLFKLYNSFDTIKRKEFYQWWEEAVEKMIVNGMFYYTGEKIQNYNNIIDKEILCFLNLVKILKLLLTTSKSKYMFENANKGQLEKYIRFGLAKCRMEERHGTEIFNLSKIFLVGINLSGADIKMANLQGANLRGANLSKTDLSGKNLREMDLRGTKLEETNLERANLRGSDLAGINLRCANLQDTVFDENQIFYLKDKYSLDNSKIYVFDEKKVISYESYCQRIKK